MARQRLTDGVDTVDFDAKVRQPNLFFETWNESLKGDLSIYKRGDMKKLYHLTLGIMPSADAAIINEWHKDKTSLTFTPNLPGAPGTTVTGRIINEGSRPFDMGDHPYDTNYTGTMVFRET